MGDKPIQVWTLQVGDQQHVVTSQEAGWAKRLVVWCVDGIEVACKASGEDKLVLVPTVPADKAFGAMRVLHSALSAPRRAIWFEGPEAQGAAHLGVGGVDLEPEPGSPLALREERMAALPRLYAARHVAAGVAKVVGPLVVAWLFARLVGFFDFSLPLPDIDRPDIELPSIPLPDIPWPDLHLPSIPWPAWALPDWLVWLIDHAKLVFPIVVGMALARSEVKRRATAAERRDALRRRGDPTDGN